MTVLIVARHGNTFAPGEPPRRVGARTDIPLTVKGIEHGQNLGAYLSKINLRPDVIYTSYLKRTIQTAQEIITAGHLHIDPRPDMIFNEIDYGPDEDQEESIVLARLGEDAMNDWEERGIVPKGWSPDSGTIIKRWGLFADKIITEHPDDVVMVVTSNGIARFSLALTGDFDSASKRFGLKLATGAFGILEHDATGWTVENWNIRP